MTDIVTNELLFETLKAIQTEQFASRERDRKLLNRVMYLETVIARIGCDQTKAVSSIKDDRTEKIFDSINSDIKWLIDLLERRIELNKNING